MLTEANRIIGEGQGYFRRRRQKRNPVLLFFGGFLCGALIFALILALFGVY